MICLMTLARAAFLLLGTAALVLPGATPARAADSASQSIDETGLQALVAGPQRSAGNRARDRDRHPLEDLRFFGIKPGDHVVEILPGGGAYWTEILAPYLREHGRYVAANPPATDSADEARKGNAAFAAKVAADPGDLGKVQIAEFGPQGLTLEPETADVVLTFRNVHNWMADGTADTVFASFFRALKPGGILGVEEHRGRPDQPQDPMAKSGYVRQDTVVALGGEGRFPAGRKLGGQRQPQGYQGLPRRRVGPAADVPAQRQGSRPLRGDRRERPHAAEVQQALTGALEPWPPRVPSKLTGRHQLSDPRGAVLLSCPPLGRAGG